MKKLTGSKLMVGIPNICADILYRTGFKASDPVVVLDDGREQFLVVSRMEVGRARLARPGLTVLTPEDLNLTPKRRRQLAHWAGALLKRVGRKRVEVDTTFPLGVARHLEREGVRLLVARQALCPGRAVKSPDEIKRIRRVQRAAVMSLRAALARLEDARVDARGMLRDGTRMLTAEAVRQTINRALLDENCAGGEPIVACGPLSSNPHWIGYGPLKAGEPIVFDIFPQDLENGYWGDLTRTVVKGRPTAALVGMYRAVHRVQADVLSFIRAGVQAASVHQRAVKGFEALGFENRLTDGVPEGFIHGTGHGVGLEIHEAPSLGRSDAVLRAGQVVTVEPGLYYRDVGGIRIEDTVVVTRTGFEYLATCPKNLVIP
jgi:Xaa-Pro aminopeptidase